MNVLKAIFDVVSWLVLFIVILLVVFTLGSNTNLLGGYKSFLVQSGSMEPSIMTGDIIIIHKENYYIKNDVVTFTNQDNRIVTHRIIEAKDLKNQSFFVTKGDANRSEDEDQITSAQIQGKVVFVVPKIGFLIGFVKSPIGFFSFIVIPGIILVVSEIIKILQKN